MKEPWQEKSVWDEMVEGYQNDYVFRATIWLTGVSLLALLVLCFFWK